MGTAKGILGTKLGMTQIYTDDSRVVPVTVIQAGPCLVTQVKTKERDGYEAVQLAYAEARRGKANRPAAGHFQAAGVKPMRHLVELRTSEAGAYSSGQQVTVLNLEVVGSDPERKLLLLRGAVPGPTGGLVMVRSSVKAGEAGRRHH